VSLNVGTDLAHETRGPLKEKMDMAGRAEELKGRVKEAAGALTGDEKLKKEGQLDQAAGQIKRAAEKMVDAVKAAVK
jgi:uncharacterized protein YjbJ (UPF0337 family)